MNCKTLSDDTLVIYYLFVFYVLSRREVSCVDVSGLLRLRLSGHEII